MSHRLISLSIVLSVPSTVSLSIFILLYLSSLYCPIILSIFTLFSPSSYYLSLYFYQSPYHRPNNPFIIASLLYLILSNLSILSIVYSLPSVSSTTTTKTTPPNDPSSTPQTTLFQNQTTGGQKNTELISTFSSPWPIIMVRVLCEFARDTKNKE